MRTENMKKTGNLHVDICRQVEKTLTMDEIEQLYGLLPFSSANVYAMILKITHLRLVDEKMCRAKLQGLHPEKKAKNPLKMMELHQLRKYLKQPDVPSVMSTLIYLDHYGMLSEFDVREFLWYTTQHQKGGKYAQRI